MTRNKWVEQTTESEDTQKYQKQKKHRDRDRDKERTEPQYYTGPTSAKGTATLLQKIVGSDKQTHAWMMKEYHQVHTKQTTYK